ncbi:MAG TPA: hypothetical protein VHM28_12285 [Anaerolineales bacterium]|jgi:hypothetical protein|nr:hypothetical protein [Anaerolineales bacterium]
MQEPKTITETLPPPPGIITSLRIGFDTIAAHVTAILLPVFLDLMLWLGPRVRVDKLYTDAYKQNYLLKIASLLGGSPEQIAQIQSSYTPESLAKIQTINLLAFLRTSPIGVSSLMAGLRPAVSPFGELVIFQAGVFDWFMWIFVMSILGWALGTFYFRWVAELVVPEGSTSIVRTLSQSLLYSVIWAFLFFTLGLPALFAFYLLFLLNSLIAEGVLLFLGFLSMWLIVPIFFSPHGIFLRKQNALASILGSFQMTRFTMPASSLFVMTVLLLSVGLNVLWSIPAPDSWLALVGILGHAFIATALLASSFVYYRDMTAWLQAVLERLRARMPSQQAQ